MGKNLVIVESPAKAKTIKKYLGAEFDVVASYGHVRDLVPKEGAVDPEHGFAMKYQLVEQNKKHVEAIAKAMKAAEVLYLATDPDREGEAISWHLQELLKEKKLLVKKPIHRIVFHEITERAITEAIANPRPLSMELVNAQQARRALDYLVGFNLSPLLWKKVRRGLSAGRVQSPALRMIAEREHEIQGFKRKEYWTLEATVAKDPDQRLFSARLTEYEGKKLTQFAITKAAQAHQVEQQLIQLAQGRLQVSQVEKKQRSRNPAAPFTTSTLQQEAARKLGFSTKRTMLVAQQLYEGVDIGTGAVGLITYMRTDSVHLAKEAVDEIRALIASHYGQDQVPSRARLFKTKAKNAQEAHEAIRPTAIGNLPELLKPYLTAEQYKLYKLIWKRTVACQMISAAIDTLAVDLQCGVGNRLRATGSHVAIPGFLAVYEEGHDLPADSNAEAEAEAHLPELVVGDWVRLDSLLSQQHFTEPPPRYTEASLVKSLEEHGIGRPSTYSSIIQTLLGREYVELDKKRFVLTDVGDVVGKFLTEHFTQYVDYNFTANMEDDLDAVSRGEKEWVPLLADFWQAFAQLVADKDSSLKREDVTHEKLDELCPKCGGELSIRLGKRGKFIGCKNYPECDYVRNLKGEETTEPEIVADRTCPKCNSPLHFKQGRYGKFIGCSNYPTCKHIEPLEKPEDSGIQCPQCKAGTLLKRKSRYGNLFYSCSTYPTCQYAVWNPPVAEPCPKCQWPILTIKTTKRRGTEKVCPQKGCGFAEPYPVEGDEATDCNAPPEAVTAE